MAKTKYKYLVTDDYYYIGTSIQSKRIARFERPGDAIDFARHLSKDLDDLKKSGFSVVAGYDLRVIDVTEVKPKSDIPLETIFRVTVTPDSTE